MMDCRRLGASCARLTVCWLAACGLGCQWIYDSDDFSGADRLDGCWYRVTDQVDDPATPENEAESPGEAWFIFEEERGSLNGCFSRFFEGIGSCPYAVMIGSTLEGSETEGTVRMMTNVAEVILDVSLSLNEEDPSQVPFDDHKAQPERIDDTLLTRARDPFFRNTAYFAKGPFRLWRAPDVGTALCPSTCGELAILTEERPGDGDSSMCDLFAAVQP